MKIAKGSGGPVPESLRCCQSKATRDSQGIFTFCAPIDVAKTEIIPTEKFYCAPFANFDASDRAFDARQGDAQPFGDGRRDVDGADVAEPHARLDVAAPRQQQRAHRRVGVERAVVADMRRRRCRRPTRRCRRGRNHSRRGRPPPDPAPGRWPPDRGARGRQVRRPETTRSTPSRPPERPRSSAPASRARCGRRGRCPQRHPMASSRHRPGAPRLRRGSAPRFAARRWDSCVRRAVRKPWSASTTTVVCPPGRCGRAPPAAARPARRETPSPSSTPACPARRCDACCRARAGGRAAGSACDARGCARPRRSIPDRARPPPCPC